MSERYQVGGTTVIDENRRGIFAKVNPGVYTTSQREALTGLSEGELVYDSTEQTLYVYTGSEWKVTGGASNGLLPLLPPFASQAETETFLSSSDGKIQFSLDDSSYSNTLLVPRGSTYYVNWGTDIRSASHGSAYSAGIGVTFTNIGPGVGGTTRTVEYEISSIDKVPNFNVGLTSSTDVGGETEFESDIISCFDQINAPAQVWVTSNAPSYKLRVGLGTWFDPPAIPSTTYVNQNEELQVKHTTGTGVLTEYKTTINVGYGTDTGEFDSVDFSTTTQNSVLNTPSITSPSNNDTVDSEVYTITASAFDGTNVGTHKNTQWQIASDSSFSTLIENVTSTSQLTTYTPTSGTSFVDQTAYVRVRYTGTLNDIQSEWSDTVNYTPQQWFLWRVSVSIGGGRGANGTQSNGGNGGSGSFTMQTGSTYSYDPPGSVSGSIGGNASGRSGGGGYGSGGTSSSCTDGNGGGGGGSTAFKYNNSTMAVVGGGGGGGREAGGGGGGGINQTGGGGASYGNAGGGGGGSTSVSAGGGGGSNCGFHSGNPDRRFSGGSGGGGGGGGGAGSGNNNESWQGGGAGGGGGGGWTTNPISGTAWSVTSGPSATRGGSGGGSYNVQLARASHSNPTQFSNRSSNTNGSSITLASLK